MKKIYTFITCMFLIHAIGKCQETDKTRIYQTISNIPVYACDVIGNKLHNDNAFSVPPYRSKFAVVRWKNDSVVIRFLDWKITNPLRQMFNDSIITQTNFRGKDTPVAVNRYFLITRNDLDSNCIKVYSRGIKSSVFTLGLITMPMKLRLGENFDFQGNLSLGTTAGVKIRISKYNPNYFNLLFGASISTVSLDSFSTGGIIKGQPLTNIAVFSPSLGAVFEFGRAQAGIFYGWDILNKSTQSKYNWIYNKKPWLSIGFGFSIFTVDSKSNNQNQGDNTVTSAKPGS